MPLRRGGDVLDVGGGADPERAAAGLVGLADARPARRSCRRSGRSGPGTNRIRSSRVARRVARAGGARPRRPRRGCAAAMLVAMPTAMPDAPLTSRFGNAAGSTVGSARGRRSWRRSRRRPRRARRHEQRRPAPAGTRCSAWPPGPSSSEPKLPWPSTSGSAQRERLGHAHQRVVDRGVAVRVELAHDLADDAGALDVAAVGAQAHLGHLEQDPALDRLEPVAGVGQGPGVDDRVGVLEERALHLLGDVDVDDALRRGGRWWRWVAAGHG